MKKLLITRPEYDIETYYLSSWSNVIINEAIKNGIKVFDLKGKKANKKILLSFLSKHEPNFVVMNGHGDETHIYGNNDVPIVSENSDEEYFENKIVYTVACDAAKSLGESITKRGNNCFIGYKEKFMFHIDSTSPFNEPMKDRIAASFFIPTNKIPMSIIRGYTTKESVEMAIDEFKKEIRKWRMSKDIEAPFILTALFWDLTFLVHLGKEMSFE
ncbi:MAG: hypothetical protein QXF88_01270 [Candidatus Aenigmatarchaeota archaeon]